MHFTAKLLFFGFFLGGAGGSGVSTTICRSVQQKHNKNSKALIRADKETREQEEEQKTQEKERKQSIDESVTLSTEPM